MGAKPPNMPVNRAFFNIAIICFNMVVTLFRQNQRNFAAENNLNVKVS